MTNKTGMKMPTRRFQLLFVVFVISIITMFSGGATSQRQSRVPPKAQPKLPDKEFTHPPEKSHDPTDFFFNFDQLEYYYRLPGEFTHRLTGDQYGFESVSYTHLRAHETPEH